MFSSLTGREKFNKLGIVITEDRIQQSKKSQNGKMIYVRSKDVSEGGSGGMIDFKLLGGFAF